MVAGAYVARNVSCLAEDGRLVIIAVQGGIDAAFDAGVLLRKRLTITGSTLRPRSVAFKSAVADSLLARVWPAVRPAGPSSPGALRPVIYRTFPAAEAAAAHQLMETNAHIGKLILNWE